MHTRGVDWSMQEELTASLLEVIDMGNRMYFSANAKKGSTPWKALVIPRPSAKRKKPGSPAKLLRAFGGEAVYTENKKKRKWRRDKDK